MTFSNTNNSEYIEWIILPHASFESEEVYFSFRSKNYIMDHFNILNTDRSSISILFQISFISAYVRGFVFSVPT